jgi:predicted RNA methylase
MGEQFLPPAMLLKGQDVCDTTVRKHTQTAYARLKPSYNQLGVNIKRNWRYNIDVKYDAL